MYVALHICASAISHILCVCLFTHRAKSDGRSRSFFTYALYDFVFNKFDPLSAFSGQAARSGMPTVTQTCLAAVALAWTAERLSPDLLACVPVAISGYEAVCGDPPSQARAAEPQKPQRAEYSPPAPQPPPVPLREEPLAKTEHAGMSDAACYCLVYLFGATSVVCCFWVCGRREQCVRSSTRDMYTQTVSLPLSISPANTILSSPTSSTVSSPARSTRGRKGVYGGFGVQ